MKPLPLAALCVLLSVAASLLVQRALAPPTRASAAPAGPAPAPAAPDERLAQLETTLAAQERALTELRRELLGRIEGLSRTALPVAAAPADEGSGQAAGADAAPAAATRERSAEDWLAELLAPDTGGLAREELWNEIARAGRTSEMVALFEARAEADPNDPNLQVELGGAYLRMVQEVGQGPLAGLWAGRADGAFDRALELDPQHVEARLSKAISLSFWPPIFGKQAEAVKQFETLIGQLEGQPLAPSQAQAWLLLGNLHQQQGQHDKAAAVWQQGAALFPSDPAFADKLGQ